jgi:hypothetical protein
MPDFDGPAQGNSREFSSHEHRAKEKILKRQFGSIRYYIALSLRNFIERAI